MDAISFILQPQNMFFMAAVFICGFMAPWIVDKRVERKIGRSAVQYLGHHGYRLIMLASFVDKNTYIEERPTFEKTAQNLKEQQSKSYSDKAWVNLVLMPLGSTIPLLLLNKKTLEAVGKATLQDNTYSKIFLKDE